MELPRAQFARALYQGLGRPIAYARAHDAAPFADLIQHACLYNPIHDRQTSVNRAPYLAELIAATGMTAFFRARILAALADPDEEMDEELLFDLAFQFAREGDAAAGRVMRMRFLDNLSSGEITGVDHLIELDGDVGLRFVVEEIGAALRRAADFTDLWLLSRLLDDLDEAFADDPVVLNAPRVLACRQAVQRSPAEQEAIERGRELRAALHTLTYVEVSRAVEARELPVTALKRWGERASEAELRNAAHGLLRAIDAGAVQQPLMVFVSRALPYGHAPLLPLLAHAEPPVAYRAARALAHFRHPELRARALALIAARDTIDLGLVLLVGNHAPGDYGLIADLVRRHADDDDLLHDIGWDVKDLFEREPAPEAVDLLLELYERGPCDQCRGYVVEHLLALGALPAHLVEECRYDANEDVRAGGGRGGVGLPGPAAGV